MEPRPGFEYMWERLKWLREKLLGDMPQRALAGLIKKRTGFKVSHVSIGRYESEDEKTRRIPKADYIEAICDLTNSTYEWVLTGTGPRERQPTGADPYQTAWREAAAELRALVERFEERAGKQTGSDITPEPDRDDTREDADEVAQVAREIDAGGDPQAAEG